MAKGQLSITPRVAAATVGDDWALGFTLYDGGTVKNVSSATISAALQTNAGATAIAATALSSSATGAAWATGVVVAGFTAAQTAALSDGDYFLEIEVTLSGAKTTWPLVPVSVQAGVIA